MKGLSPFAVRSLLFSPGNVEKMLIKAHGSNANVQILDLEDSVPLSSKGDARKLVNRFLKENAETSSPLFCPRVNNVPSLLKDDLNSVCVQGVWGVTIGKIESRDEVLELESMVDSAERSNGVEKGSGYHCVKRAYTFYFTCLFKGLLDLFLGLKLQRVS